MIPCNVWLLDSPELVLNYSLQGGRVIFITEDDDPRLQFVPNKIPASILLPPYDALSDELDGNIDLSERKYYAYLSSPEPSEFIGILLSAALQNVKVGIYFGNEMKELKYPMMFINYLYRYTGLSVGYKNVMPGFLPTHLPMVVSDLLCKYLISPEQFLTMMPAGVDLPEFVIPLLVQAFRPALVENNEYNKYFKDLILEIKKSGKYLYSPIVAPEVR